MAVPGKSLLYQHGVGLAFLATVRPDARPRVHPMCPLVSDEGLFAFIVPSPKQGDLKRSGAYALHSFPCPTNEDAFYVTGEAAFVTDAERRDALARQFVAEREAFGVVPPSRTMCCSSSTSSRACSRERRATATPRPTTRSGTHRVVLPPTLG